MITRRQLLQWSATLSASLGASAKAFAARLPRLGSIAAQVKTSADSLSGKIYYKDKDGEQYEIYRQGASLECAQAQPLSERDRARRERTKTLSPP